MSEITNWQDAIIIAGAAVMNRLALFVPNLLGALLVFTIGWMLSGWMKSLITRLFVAVQLHRLVEGTGVERFIKKAEIKGRAEDIVGGAVKWLIVFVFTIASINILGLPTVSAVLNNILGYIPKVVSASIILLVGTLLAGVVESVMKGAFGAIDVSVSRLLGKISSWIVMVFTVLAAVSELGIAEQFINTIVIGGVATLSIGLGLAIGLGSKDIIRELLSEWYASVRSDLKKKT